MGSPWGRRYLGDIPCSLWRNLTGGRGAADGPWGPREGRGRPEAHARVRQHRESERARERSRGPSMGSEPLSPFCSPPVCPGQAHSSAWLCLLQIRTHPRTTVGVCAGRNVTRSPHSPPPSLHLAPLGFLLLGDGRTVLSTPEASWSCRAAHLSRHFCHRAWAPVTKPPNSRHGSLPVLEAGSLRSS